METLLILGNIMKRRTKIKFMMEMNTMKKKNELYFRRTINISSHKVFEFVDLFRFYGWIDYQHLIR